MTAGRSQVQSIRNPTIAGRQQAEGSAGGSAVAARGPAATPVDADDAKKETKASRPSGPSSASSSSGSEWAF